jgi:hypothetical protein
MDFLEYRHWKTAGDTHPFKRLLSLVLWRNRRRKRRISEKSSGRRLPGRSKRRHEIVMARRS